MRIEIRSSGSQSQPMKKVIDLDAGKILRFLTTEDDSLATLILCKSSEIYLRSTDYQLYMALGSMKPYDNFNQSKLVKLLEVVDFKSYRCLSKRNKPVLTEKNVEDIRLKALKGNNNDNNKKNKANKQENLGG